MNVTSVDECDIGPNYIEIYIAHFGEIGPFLQAEMQQLVFANIHQ